jgi:hypothetical protein
MIHAECLCCIGAVVGFDRAAGMAGGEVREVIELAIHTDMDLVVGWHLIMTAFVRLTVALAMTTALAVTTAAATATLLLAWASST